MNKSTSYRHLHAFEERHNCKISEEDLIDVLNVIQLYLKFEEQGEMDETTTKTTKNKKTTKPKTKEIKEVNTSKKKKNTIPKRQTASINNNEIMEKIRNMKYELGRLPSAEELKTANIDTNKISKEHGGWRKLKNKLKDTSEEEKLFQLMEKLERIPTREDLQENKVSIENLLLQYGTYREVKDKLNMAERYEELLKKKLETMKKEENLTMENCKAKGIDINFLIRKHGGWKMVLQNLQLV